MFQNQFLLMARSFKKRKVFFALNILCLSIGFATYFALHRYISYENSFDNFHREADRIVRVHASRFHKNILTKDMADGCLAAGPDIKESFQEVEQFVRMKKSPAMFYYKGDWTKSDKTAYVSEEFFKVFSCPLIKGSDSLALKRPYTIVLSENLARRIFKANDPIGKTVNFRGRLDLEVTGIFEDMPGNSHMDLDALISFETYLSLAQPMVVNEPWRWDGFYTYLKLAPHASLSELESKLPALVETKTGEWLKNTEQKLSLSLKPLRSLHLHSNLTGEWKINSDGKTIFYLELISVGVLLLALINYISLTTAQSLERAREVGLRKVLGSSRGKLILQFILETTTIMLLAIAVAIVWVELAQQIFPREKFLLHPWNVLTTKDWSQLFGIVLIAILIAAIYPAFILSGFQPAKVLKSSGITSSDSSRVRRALVTVQFILSLTLIVWIFTAAKQMDYLRSQPLGFDQDMKLVIRDSEVFDSLYRKRVASFRTEVVRVPGVRNMTYIETLPGDAFMPYANSIRRLKADTTQASAINYCGVDEQFADVLKLTKKAGELFTETTPKFDVVITTSAAKELGYVDVNDAVNDDLLFRDDTVKIKGVIEDFYFYTPKQAIQPLIFQYNRTAGYYYVLDVESSDTKAIIGAVEKLFRSEFIGQPFEYFFLDDHYNKQYATETEFESGLFFLSSVSILLTCVGLAAMAFYTSLMRKKEIGIRKTFGASSGSVAALLVRQYLMLIGIASLIALPLAFYLCSEWLKAFVVKIELSAWTFVIPLIALVTITLVAVGTQTIRAALKNPVDSLYHE